MHYTQTLLQRQLLPYPAQSGGVHYLPQNLLRRITAAQVTHIGVVVALGEAATVGGGEQRQVSEFWDVVTQLLIKENLQMCARQKVAAAHHFRNSRECVVHRDRQLICKDTVGASNHKVAAVFLQVATLLAIIAVNKNRLLVWYVYTLRGTAEFEHCGVLFG